MVCYCHSLIYQIIIHSSLETSAHVTESSNKYGTWVGSVDHHNINPGDVKNPNSSWSLVNISQYISVSHLQQFPSGLWRQLFILVFEVWGCLGSPRRRLDTSAANTSATRHQPQLSMLESRHSLGQLDLLLTTSWNSPTLWFHRATEGPPILG